MGHLHLRSIPRTHNWIQVISLLSDGAPLPEVASSTLNASRRGLMEASGDVGLVHSTWLLTQILQAAKGQDFGKDLSKLGIRISGHYSATDFVCAVSDAIDTRLENNKGRTDLGELAQLAAVESLTHLCGGTTQSLFGTTASDIRMAFKGLSSPDGFTKLARDYFSRLTYRYLTYFLSQELSNHVGGDRRFENLQQHIEFKKALKQHCSDASRIVQEFSGGWYGKAIFKGGITPQKMAGFVHIALKKISEELEKGGEVTRLVNG